MGTTAGRGVVRRTGGRIRDLSATRERKTAWWGSSLATQRRVESVASTPGAASLKPAFEWTRGRALETARLENSRTRGSRPLRVARRSAVPLIGAVLLVSGIVLAAGVFLILSNTAKDAGSVGVFYQDWTVVVDIPPSLTVATPASISYTATRNSPARDYGAAGFINVCFQLLIGSNHTAADFDSVSLTFAPAGDAFTKADLTTLVHPLNPVITGPGISKCYPNAIFSVLPAAGSSATITGTFALVQTYSDGTFEVFGSVRGEK